MVRTWQLQQDVCGKREAQAVAERLFVRGQCFDRDANAFAQRGIFREQTLEK